MTKIIQSIFLKKNTQFDMLQYFLHVYTSIYNFWWRKLIQNTIYQISIKICVLQFIKLTEFQKPYMCEAWTSHFIYFKLLHIENPLYLVPKQFKVYFILFCFIILFAVTPSFRFFFKSKGCIAWNWKINIFLHILVKQYLIAVLKE